MTMVYYGILWYIIQYYLVLEAFVHNDMCPRWLLARYRQHNRAQLRKRKRGQDDDRALEDLRGGEALDSSRKPRVDPEASTAAGAAAGEGTPSDEDVDARGFRSKLEVAAEQNHGSSSNTD